MKGQWRSGGAVRAGEGDHVSQLGILIIFPPRPHFHGIRYSRIEDVHEVSGRVPETNRQASQLSSLDHFLELRGFGLRPLSMASSIASRLADASARVSRSRLAFGRMGRLFIDGAFGRCCSLLV